MALSSVQQNSLFKLTVGLFNAAPGSFYTEVQGIVIGSQTEAAAAQVLIDTPAFQAILPSKILTNAQFSTKFIDMLVGSTVSAANKTWAASQIEAKLNAGETQGAAAWWAIDELSKVSTSNADWGAAAATLLNKVDVAKYFTVDKYVASNSLATLQGLLADVTSSTASVATAKSNGPTTDILLATSKDGLFGTSGNDLFNARIIDNANTLQSGDSLNGGAGTDTLYADVGNSQKFAITAETVGVETVKIRAQAVSADTTENNLSIANKVQIDAQRMKGVNTWENTNSRADLLIEDVRIGDAQITKDITIVMRETDPGHSDFGVYFDQNSLRNVSSSTSQINLQVMDTRAVVDGKAPLLNSPYGGFRFTSTNTATGVATVITLQSQAIDDAQTYAQLAAAFQAAADAQFGAGVVTAAVGSSFTVTDTTTGAGVTGSEIVLSTAGAFTFTTPTGSGWIANGVVPANSGLHTNFNTGGATSVALVTSTIVLDDVGRGSTGGDLVVGGLSVGDTSTSKGVQRFEITVEDNSKLQSINSTNNTLREVNIVNGTTSRTGYGIGNDAYTSTTTNAGNLTVNGKVDNLDADGQVSTSNVALPGSEAQHNGSHGFSDVRLIDGSTMNGQLAFTAEITSKSIAKYLNLADTANNPASDNVAFVYSGGNNNDTIVVDIDSSIAASTNTLSGREDFTFTINGGAGNDTITTDFVGVGSAAWIADQKQNANATIDGGAGNDTIWTKGDGAVIINAGTGDDTVYADNTGTIGAKWAVNDGAPAILTDLFTNGATKGFLYNGKLTVAFSGAGGTGLGGGVTAGAADSTAANFTNGFEVVVNIPTGTNYEVTQLHLNQAIKAAINGDAVLSKLLTATDGPANTLVVSSKIDGTFNAADLKMSVTSTDVTTLAASEQATVLAAFKTYAHNSAAVIATAQTANAASVTAFNAVAGMDANQMLGANSGSGITVTTAVTTQGVTAVQEVFTVDFTGIVIGGVGANTVVFDGTATAGLAAGATAAQVAAAVVAAGNTANWTVGAAVGNTVTFTKTVAGAVADTLTGAFTETGAGNTHAAAITTGTQGVTAVQEVFTATVSGLAAAAETVTFDALATAALNAGDTGAAIATALQVANAGAAGTWQATAVAGNVVTFTQVGAGAAIADVTGAAFVSSVATVAANGTISSAESDNTINMAAGSDVLVMGTGANSNDTLVFTGYDNGKETVVNFEDTVVASRDMVDFRSYLTGKSSASGSVESQLPIAVTLNGNASVEANSVTVVNGTFTTTDTFAGLTAAKLLAAVNSTNTGTANFAGITAATLDAVNTYNTTNTLVGGTGHGVVLVQNNLNEGEYAVFDVTFNGLATNATADFSAATLIGVVDFGNTVDFTNVLVGF